MAGVAGVEEVVESKTLCFIVSAVQDFDLSLAARETAVVHGMGGANVIAGEAVGAVVSPVRQAVGIFQRDVLQRTNLGTRAAAFAPCLLHSETGRRNEETIEERTKHVSLQSRQSPRNEVGSSGTSFVFNDLNHFFKSGLPCILFGLLNFCAVGVKTGKTDIGVSHSERENGVKPPPRFLQRLSQQDVGASDVIAAGEHGIDIARSGDAGQTFQKLLHHPGKSPSIDGKDETDLVVAHILQRNAGHVGETFTESSAQRAGDAERITCAGEIENHV